MPPRISLPTWLRPGVPANAPFSSASLRLFSSSPISNASKPSKKRRGQDPYAMAQARARKAANLSRQEVLRKERAEALGDPVRGVTTAFVQSFDTGVPVTPQVPGTEAASPAKPKLNYFVQAEDVETSVRKAQELAAPLAAASQSTSELSGRINNTISSVLDTMNEKSTKSLSPEEAHARATEAISRIVSINNASSKDRLRINVQRCIDTFGRHNTDQVLPPRPRAALTPESAEGAAQEKKPRAGPDTGSSEVQIAILTAKIRTMANMLEKNGNGDKHNKRNLRVLVHKRQKLLKYLRRKERGGPRWQNLIETLGLTEGTWKGEISL